MDLQTKIKYAKLHTDNIADHDDAPKEEVRAALAEVVANAQSKLETLTADRAARQPAPVEPAPAA